jgi:methionine aminopeptidase
LEEYFETDKELYKQLIQEYMEYTIDISVNEYSVHWCGFSSHELHVPYKDFEGLFLPQF